MISQKLSPKYNSTQKQFIIQPPKRKQSKINKDTGIQVNLDNNNQEISNSNNESVSSQMCLICQEYNQDLRQCLDCHKLFCMKCAVHWVKQKNQCPMKCCEYNWNIDLREIKQKKEHVVQNEVCEQSLYGNLMENTTEIEPITESQLIINNLQHHLASLQTEPEEQYINDIVEDGQIHQRRRRTSPGHTPRYQGHHIHHRQNNHESSQQQQQQQPSSNRFQLPSLDNSNSSQKKLKRMDSLEIARKRQQSAKMQIINQNWMEESKNIQKGGQQ